jgi:hypothetical protein
MLLLLQTGGKIMVANGALAKGVVWTKVRWQLFRRWAVEGAPLWKWLVVSSLCCAAPFGSSSFFGYPSAFDDRVHLAGLILQLIGLFAVVRDLNSMAREFGGRHVLEPIIEFWNHFLDIFRGPRSVAFTLQGVAGRAEVRGVGVAMHHESHGSVEERLKNLEERMRRQEKEIPAIYTAIDDHVRRLTDRIEEERKEREAAAQEFADSVRGVMIGNLGVKLGGFAYLFLGTILTAIPLR